jgi:hypothetical protein
MLRKSYIYILTACALVLLIWIISNKKISNGGVDNRSGQKDASFDNPAPVAPKSSNLERGLESIARGLAGVGAAVFKSPDAEVTQAVKSGDQRKIARAFSDLVYSTVWSREQKIQVLQTFLNDEDAWIIIQAAEKLYVLGDESGRVRLVKIVASPVPIMQNSSVSGAYDLRVRASGVLSKFRDWESAPAILSLYETTHSPALLDDLAKVHAVGAADLIQAAAAGGVSPKLMELIGLTKEAGKERFIAEVQADINQDVETRLAASWALLRLKDDGPSFEYISNFVELQLLGGRDVYPNIERAVVKYLGSLPGSAYTQLLEKIVQQTSDPDVFRIGVANLILNKERDSKIAEKIVAEELAGRSTRLGLDLTIKLTMVSVSPVLKDAGALLDSRGEGGKIWKQQGVGRSQWSIWAWADDYVLALIDKP